MHITNFKVFNFKSYKHFILRENLSPGVNIFIGYNGSGKTTLLQAINCIFSLKQTNFRHPDVFISKTQFFNSQKFLSMIEISFDNSDRFFPVANNQIIIRRIFGSNIDKFFLGNCYILPNHFLDFLSLKKVYLDNLVFKIEQGMHLEFKNVSPKKRLKIFIYSIGLSCFELFEKKSIEYLLKINLCKKKLLNLIEKIKKKEKYLSRKLKLYKKNSNIINAFLVLKIMYTQMQLKIFEKKKTQIKNNYFQQSKIIKIINIRLCFIKEENFYIKYKSNLKNYNKKNNYLLHSLIYLCYKNDFILFKSLIISYFAYDIPKMESRYNLLRLSNKYYDKVKRVGVNKFKIYNSILNENKNNINYENVFFFNQHSLYIRKYKILHSFQKKNANNRLLKPDTSFFIEKIIEQIKISKLKFLRFENKIFSFLHEISIEKEKIRINLFNYENDLEFKLGIKTLKGIKKLMGMYKTTDNFKFKIYGLVIDLILVHRYFYRPVESLLSKYYTHIVVKDKNTVLNMISICKEKLKTKIDFITLLGKSNFNVITKKKYELFINLFPILLTVFYRPNFNILFKRLLDNIYFVDSQQSKDLFCKYNYKIVNLDGNIFYPDGYIIINTSYQTKTTLELVNLLKKGRFFFSWLQKYNQKILKLVELLFFLKEKIHFLNNFLNKLFKLISLKNVYNNFNLEIVNKLEFFLSKIIIKENVYVNNFRNKKIYRFFSKKLVKQNEIQLLLIQNKISFWNLYIFYLFKQFYLNSKMTFYLESFYYKASQTLNKKFFHSRFNQKKKNQVCCKNFTKFSKQFCFYYSIFFFFRYFFKKRILSNFYLKSLILICFFNKKKNNNSKLGVLNFIIKGNKHEVKKKLLILFYKFSKKKCKIKIKQKSKNSYCLLKLFSKVITKFNQLETDLILVNQTFDILVRKKKEKIKTFLIIVSKNFSKIFSKNLSNGKAAIIIKYKMKYLTNINKLYQQINIIGITILAKFTSANSIYFLEQMSSGQGSVVSFFFFISLRVVNFVLIYILDEFDANLDSDNTILFSYIIKEISTFGIQFLISTFNQNFILNGDKWFGILSTNKGSYVQNVNRNVAVKFNKTNKDLEKSTY
nr:structural maintenance of chromosomes 3 [Cryptomonas curvata]